MHTNKQYGFYPDNVQGFLSQFLLSCYSPLFIEEKNITISFEENDISVFDSTKCLFKEPYSNIDYVWYDEKSSLVDKDLIVIKTKDSKFIVETGKIKNKHPVKLIFGDVLNHNICNLNNDKIHIFNCCEQIKSSANYHDYKMLTDEEAENIKKDVNEIVTNKNEETKNLIAKKKEKERIQQIMNEKHKATEKAAGIILVICVILALIGGGMLGGGCAMDKKNSAKIPVIIVGLIFCGIGIFAVGIYSAAHKK